MTTGGCGKIVERIQYNEAWDPQRLGDTFDTSQAEHFVTTRGLRN